MKSQIESTKNIKLEIPEPIELDFSALKNLKGNKIILEYVFQLTKKEMKNG
jgi:hypothetical protein